MAGSLFESGDKIGGMSQDDLSSFVQQQITNPMWSALKNADNQRMLAPNPPPQSAGQIPIWDGNQWVAKDWYSPNIFCLVYSASPGAITNDTAYHTPTLGTVYSDTYGLSDGTGITVKVSAMYNVGWTTQWPVNATGNVRFGRWSDSSGNSAALDSRSPVAGGASPTQSIGIEPRFILAGSAITLNIGHNATTNLTPTFCSLWVSRVA